LADVKWIRRFPVDSLQIYFPSSLEIQNELIKNGFNVPADKSRKIKTPIPLIYSNFRGWIKKPDPITYERLIPPEWYGKTPQELGWKETVYNGKKAYYIPEEEVYVYIGSDNSGLIYFKVDIKEYHLERTSIRGVNPEKWTNWAMFYINAKYISELIDIAEASLETFSSFKLNVVKEVQQGGKEVTYYAALPKHKKLGVPIKYYSLCIGCFDKSLKYLEHKAIENNLDTDVIRLLKLRINKSPSVNAGIKIGVAKIKGKESQVMFKLTSNTPTQIKGILKSVIKGKARGKLAFCDHNSKLKLLVIDGYYVYSALRHTMPLLKNL